MATITSLTELRNMPVSDLRKEVMNQRNIVAKMHLGIEMSKEKDTARYQREKKQLARMLTVLKAKEAEGKKAEKEKATTTTKES